MGRVVGDSVTDGGEASPFHSPYSPVPVQTPPGRQPPADPVIVAELQQESKLLTKLLEEEKLLSRSNAERADKLAFDNQKLAAQAKSLQHLLEESLGQLDTRRSAVRDHAHFIVALWIDTGSLLYCFKCCGVGQIEEGSSACNALLSKVDSLKKELSSANDQLAIHEADAEVWTPYKLLA